MQNAASKKVIEEAGLGGIDPGPVAKKMKTEHVKSEPADITSEPTVPGPEAALASEELQIAFDGSCKVAVPKLAGMAIVFYNEHVYLYNNTASPLTVKGETSWRNSLKANGSLASSLSRQA